MRIRRIVKKYPGTVLLSRSQMYSTIAAGALNCRVREGNVCFCSAISTGNFIKNKDVEIVRETPAIQNSELSLLFSQDSLGIMGKKVVKPHG